MWEKEGERRIVRSHLNNSHAHLTRGLRIKLIILHQAQSKHAVEINTLPNVALANH